MPIGSLEKKTREKFKHTFKDDQFGERLLIALIFFVFLTLFFHFREVQLQVLELNARAKNYVVAQVDFQFPDDEATLVLRQESIKDIGLIYKINTDEVRRVRLEFENYLINHRNWRVKVYRSSFEQMYNVADVLEQKLIELRLTDSRTFDKISDNDVEAGNFEELPGPIDEKEMKLPGTIWNNLKSEIIDKYRFDRDAVEYVIDYFESINWNIEEDYETQRFYRQLIEASIPEKYTQVKAGSKVLDQGEMVSQRHLSMIKSMKQELGKQRNLLNIETILASALFSLIVTVIGIIYLQINHRTLVLSLRKLSLYVTIIILTLGLSKLVEYLFLSQSQQYFELLRYPLFVPFAAIMICVLIDKNVALFSTFILTVIMGIALAVDHSRFLYINLVASLATILFAKSLRKRKEVFIVCAMAWIASLPVIIAFKLSEQIFFEMTLVNDLISTFICMFVTAILIVSVLPLIETIFQVMTDMTLMEFMDPNNELLRRLSIEAPGTYQHSLVVGSLSEAAAQAIGANGLFCRVSTLYHDIGKLFNPHYFTENQMGGFDIHQLLTPTESAQVIIAHVAEGEALAKKHGLPRPFIDIIREHHGTTIVYYFYSKQIEQMGGDVESVNKSQFQYPGPKPRSKESAIIMIADSVEAASRSMEEPSEDAIRELVDRLVSEKADEGQFDDCQLTFEELGIVKKTIVKTVSVTRHLRVKYPERIKR